MNCRISANLITLNEERNLAACLGSLDWVDEIVVVDGGSDDRTVEIARRFTDRIVVYPFDDFASQRNRAMDISRGDWIISIDADERVDWLLATEIRRATHAAAGAVRGFWVPIRSRIFGRRFRHSGTQRERKLRLFRRGAGRWRGTVHEVVELDGPAGQLKHAVEHHSTPDLDTYLRKLIRYSALEADRLHAAGVRPNWSRTTLRPLATFLRLYLLKLGFLDGPEGFRFCALSAWNSWVTEQKLAERHRAQMPPRFAEQQRGDLNLAPKLVRSEPLVKEDAHEGLPAVA